MFLQIESTNKAAVDEESDVDKTFQKIIAIQNSLTILRNAFELLLKAIEC